VVNSPGGLSFLGVANSVNVVNPLDGNNSVGVAKSIGGVNSVGGVGCDADSVISL
jgi:hypothetical protein